jgi:hypothetical protein
LYWLDEKMQMHKHPASVVGTFTNRYIHNPSNQAFIGPHVIDTKGNVRTIETLKDFRLTSVMDHLTDPKNKIYVLAMEGEFFEVDVNTLETKQLFDLAKELDIRGRVHFKGAFSANGRVVVANNSYYEADYLGKDASWRVSSSQRLSGEKDSPSAHDNLGISRLMIGSFVPGLKKPRVRRSASANKMPCSCSVQLLQSRFQPSPTRPPRTCDSSPPPSGCAIVQTPALCSRETCHQSTPG